MTPGTHPQRVSSNTMTTDPHPRSYTASGGKKIARRTRRRDIGVIFLSNLMISNNCMCHHRILANEYDLRDSLQGHR